MGKRKFLASQNDDMILEIADDNLSATLTINSRADLIMEEDISRLIEMAGIKCGFEEARKFNEEHEISKDYDKPFLIAHCPLPENPKVYYLFNNEKCVDPENVKSVYHLRNSKAVSIGDPVAEVVLTEAMQVHKIHDIFGEEIDAKELNDTILDDHLGKFVYYSEDTKQILAEKAGYVYLDDDNKISIMTDFHFIENISDTVLDLKGNIIIDGNIDAAHLNLDGNLTVNGLIRNCLDDCCFINGSVNAESIENSYIACNGDLNFKKSIRFSVLSVDGQITGDEGSSIVGGLSQASGNITTDYLGSPFSITTELDITVSPFSKEMIKCLENEENSNDITKGDESLKEIYYNIIQDNLEAILDNEVENKVINIRKTIYSDSKLRVYKDYVVISDEQQGIEFMQNSDDG